LVRRFAVLWALLLAAAAPAPAVRWPQVRPGVPLAFPRDHGAHPGFRTEWWYATGWLKTAAGQDLGFQVTFFRVRPGLGEDNPSAFAPRQILFAHAALSDPAAGRLRHGQRIARAGFGLAAAAVGDAALVIDDWRLQRRADGAWTTRAGAGEFDLDLIMTPRQPLLVQGDGGYSRKGPDPASASHYYSIPQLRVSGHIVRDGRREAVTGIAWLDREWSSALLDARATGWDWLGLNMDDGGALTLFQVRGPAGRPVWAGGSFRSAAGVRTVLAPADVRFLPGRSWRSRRSGTLWPVAPVLMVRLPGGWRRLPVTPLFPDQELDSRPAGPLYWEGAVRVPGGRGYLELTGYGERLRM
jgi:predicted secreted hydrolase